MRKLFTAFVVLAVLAAVAAPVFAAGGNEKATKDLTIGVVIPYEIGWFTAYHKGYEVVANKLGVKLVFAYHNYKADEEVKAIQNLITQGVDAINLTAFSSESAEYSCRLANDAKIPIQVTESGVAQGKGVAVANIDFNWFDVYKVVAEGLRKDVQGDLNVLHITGFAGTAPIVAGNEGFKATMANLQGIKLATAPQDGQYATEPSLKIATNLITSGLKFNVAVGGCQEITDGIIQALKQSKVDRKAVTVVSVNGGPMDIENFKNGNLDYCLSQSPALHGMINAANLIAYMRGQTYQKKTFSPVVWVSSKDWQAKYIPWDVDETWLPVVNEFVKTGQYKPELRTK